MLTKIVGWQDDARSILGKFLSRADVESGIEEIRVLLLREGPWGKIINDLQSSIRPPQGHTMNAVQLEVWKQKRMLRSTINLWKIEGAAQFKFIPMVAVRALSMTIQSADVERSCKAHKVIHTKARNRLKNRNVFMLLYTYLNLRLVNKVKDELQDFLEQALAGDGDEDSDEGAQYDVENDSLSESEAEEDADEGGGGEAAAPAIGAGAGAGAAL